MVTNTLSINLSVPPDPEKFWIRLEQIMPEETATMAEAAEAIDNLLALDPCKEQPEDQTVDEKVEEHKLTLEQIEQRLKDAEENLKNQIYGIKNEICTEDGCWTATIKIFRSHQQFPYTMLIAGGELLEKIVGLSSAKKITVPVKESSSVSMELQADAAVTATWQGAVISPTAGILDAPPQITRTNSGFSFPGIYTGTLLVSVEENYDKAAIKVTDPDGCTVTAITHLATDEISLQEPPQDKASEDLCKKIKREYNTPIHQGDCFKIIEHNILCNCSEANHPDSYHEHVPVPCPEGSAPGQIVERETTTSYVSCDEKDKVNDPDFYRSVCCKEPPSGLPRCSEVYQAFSGKGLSPDRLKDLLDIFGPAANVVSVMPSDGLCGRIITKQIIDVSNCCDGIEPLSVDKDHTAKEISPGGSALISLKGDRVGDVTWTCLPSFHFINGKTKIITDVGSVWVYANTELCRFSDLAVRAVDSCSVVDIQIPIKNNETKSVNFGDYDYVAGKNAEFYVWIYDGIPPFNWAGDDKVNPINPKTESRVNKYISSPDFCGSAHITVTDSCLETATTAVRSTDGAWVEQDLAGYDICRVYKTWNPFITDTYYGCYMLSGGNIVIVGDLKIEYLSEGSSQSGSDCGYDFSGHKCPDTVAMIGAAECNVDSYTNYHSSTRYLGEVLSESKYWLWDTYYDPDGNNKGCHTYTNYINKIWKWECNAS